ncbi:putative 3-(3-hydroxy-phenyl) propionate hydroxylase [Rhodococcoides trifolii]|uniref:3-(3-hydroxy-phenyl) propionate hydroxylase n=1 Tax=Rhodococcoides trifolii TaxID=908250 RepID=A0A917G5C1_9NOCA|nr:bifunctional 3-(3-hydroxy-phenyl)propionate/3-hydroxycinnamic acid hydroxylase [Rhodococcus trifolii]GGG23926.1 putative 3-(3-hydroxy-phenyl) propionate hydroxylase [Rhodococcus trifolii]
MTTAPVVIVGAGPSGLVAATLLAQYGIESIVLERHPQHYPLPRAVHLDGEIYRLLQHLGLDREFATISRPARGMRLVDATLNVIAELDRSASTGVHSWPEANMFDQPELELMLRSNLKRHPEVRFMTGVEVLRIDRPADVNDPVVVHIRDENTRMESTLETRFLFGADGANSGVRAGIGSELDDLHFSEKWLVVDVRLDFELPVWDGVFQICDADNPASFMQIGPDRFRWEFRLPEGESGVVPYPESHIRELLSRWIPPSKPGVEIIRCTSYTFRARVADHWRRGNIFLVGDAAHSTPPFIGQGMGAGFRDAFNLAWKVAWVLRGDASAELLDTYEAERKPQVTNVIRSAVVIGWAMTGGSGKRGRFVQKALSRTFSLPGVSTLASNLPVPPLGRSALVTRRRPIGAIFPQQRTGVSRSDDLLGEGFSVVHRGKVGTEMARVANRLNARLVEAGAEHVEWTSWLKKHRTGSVLLRPDRVVAATESSVDDVQWDALFATSALP